MLDWEGERRFFGESGGRFMFGIGAGFKLFDTCKSPEILFWSDGAF